MPDLGDLTSQCIRCGFCLESCPTFLLTGDESQSPRGRITLAEQAHQDQNWTASTNQAIETCVGCRACETACPSGVQYGEILELARQQLQPKFGNRHHRSFINSLTNSTTAKWQFELAALLPIAKPPSLIAKTLSPEPAEAEIPKIESPAPWPPISPKELPAVRGQVALLEGCVMQVLYPGVHEATIRLLRRVGYQAAGTGKACCGALHAHSGFATEASQRAQSLLQAVPKNTPLVVNSAGCGSTIKSHGDDLANRTFDAAEFLFNHGITTQLSQAPGFPNLRVAYHPACHLHHGQNVITQPLDLLRAIPGVNLIPLNEAELCCGSAGTYNIFQPKMARQLLDRKWANIEHTQVDLVVTGNPGCHAWIAQAAREHASPVRVLHTLELLESAFSGLRI